MFGVTWTGNVASATIVYAAARRYGRTFLVGPLGRRLVPPVVLAHIAAAYERHGGWGIFVSRLLPVWRAVVPPFAGVAGVGAARALVPVALASGLWYGAITYVVATLGSNLDVVLAALQHVNRILGVLALVTLLGVAWYVARRLKLGKGATR